MSNPKNYYSECKDRAIRRFQVKFVTHFLKLGSSIREAAELAGLDRSNFIRIMRRNEIHGEDFPAGKYLAEHPRMHQDAHLLRAKMSNHKNKNRDQGE